MTMTEFQDVMGHLIKICDRLGALEGELRAQRRWCFAAVSTGLAALVGLALKSVGG